MALLFSHPFDTLSAFDAAFEDLLSPDFGPPASSRYASCGRMACAGPSLPRRGLAAAVLPAMPAPRAYRLRCQPTLQSPPGEGDLHITRSRDGVLATCPLGRSFSPRDISLKLTSRRDLTVTAYNPGTAHWPERPAVFRRTFELAEHIDVGAIHARLEAGVLTIAFPYRRPQQPPRRILIQGPACFSTSISTSVPAPAPALAPVSAVPAQAAAPRLPERCRRQPRPQQQAHHCRQGPTPDQVLQQAQRAEQASASAAFQLWQQHQQQLLQQLCRVAAAAPAATPQAARQQHSPRQQQSPQHQQEQLRVVPIGSVEQEEAAPHQQQQQQEEQQQSRPSSPTPATASPKAALAPKAEAPAAAMPASPADDAGDKGKAAAGPDQLAAMEQREAARRAAERIAAGIASDDDWEEADGSIADCPI